MEVDNDPGEPRRLQRLTASTTRLPIPDDAQDRPRRGPPLRFKPPDTPQRFGTFHLLRSAACPDRMRVGESEAR